MSNNPQDHLIHRGNLRFFLAGGLLLGLVVFGIIFLNDDAAVGNPPADNGSAFTHTNASELLERTPDTESMEPEDLELSLEDLILAADSEEQLRALLREALPDREDAVIRALSQIDTDRFNLYWVEADLVDYLRESYGPVEGIKRLDPYLREEHPVLWNAGKNLLRLYGAQADAGALRSFVEDPINRSLVNVVAHDLGIQMARQDPLSAVATAEGLEGVSHQKMLNGALMEWYSQDYVAVAEYLNTVEPHAKYDDVTNAYVTKIKYNDPAVAMTWALAMQGTSYQRETVMEVADVWFNKDADAFQSWIDQLSDEELKGALVKQYDLSAN
ncbi:MAG: hypothetical protein AAFX93_18485 [Verrucomicrobiota bacterium]